MLVLKAAPSGRPASRFGFAVSKRLGGAVQRNLVRRRLREAARLAAARPGWDIVVIARVPAARASFHELRAALEQLLRRARILEEHGIRNRE